MLREEFAYQPTIKVSQFFGGGFAQVKITFLCDVIRLCRTKHQLLWKKQKDAKTKVETKGYLPNARLQARKTPVAQPPAPKSSPKRRSPAKLQPAAAAVPLTARTPSATALGPLGPVGLGGLSYPAPTAQQTQPTWGASPPNTYTYVDEADYGDALSAEEQDDEEGQRCVEEMLETSQRDPLMAAPMDAWSEPEPPAAPLPQTAPVAEAAHATAGQGQGESIDAAMLRDVLSDFTGQIKDLMTGMESRLGLFEMRVDGSLSELQAKVTLMEGRLKFVERTAATGTGGSMKVKGNSAPASPMKEPTEAAAKPAASVKDGGGSAYGAVTQVKGAAGEAPFESHTDTLDFVEAVAARFSGASNASDVLTFVRCNLTSLLRRLTFSQRRGSTSSTARQSSGQRRWGREACVSAVSKRVFCWRPPPTPRVSILIATESNELFIHGRHSMAVHLLSAAKFPRNLSTCSSTSLVTNPASSATISSIVGTAEPPAVSCSGSLNA